MVWIGRRWRYLVGLFLLLLLLFLQQGGVLVFELRVRVVEFGRLWLKATVTMNPVVVYRRFAALGGFGGGDEGYEANVHALFGRQLGAKRSHPGCWKH